MLTLANLWRAMRSREQRLRVTWLGSAVAALIERALTFGFFIPTLLELFDASMPQADAVRLAKLWVRTLVEIT